jgi:outer membrane protein OmpA-like peptidoglycan-associated protein
MNFCTNCGSPLQPGLKFCTGCGRPAAPAEAALLPPSPAPAPQASEPVVPQDVANAPEAPSASEWQPAGVVAALSPPSDEQPLPAAASTHPAASSKSSCLPAILITLAVLAVIAVLVIGGVVYAGYKLKQKATAMLHEATSASAPATPGAQPGAEPGSKPASPTTSPQGNPAGLLGNLSNMLGGDDDGDLVQSISDKDPVEPCPLAPFPSQSAARIPLQPGTVITTAWGMKNGDVETRVLVTGITSTSMTQTMTSEAFKDDDGYQWKASSSLAEVCSADLASADTYVNVWNKTMPHLIHGVTRDRLSSKSFEEAKSPGKTSLRYLDITTNGDDVKPNYVEGILTRVEPQDVPYPMIVNDQRVNLPAVHLSGIVDSVGKDPRPKKERPNHAEADIYIVDDPLDPLVLLWKEKDPALHDGKFRVEVVKIDYTVPHPVNLVEKQLTEQKRAVTYGIYFDFNKDTIKPESEPVLKEIVQAMTDNPGWKLTVEGHTDNIGGDAYNLDLSKRRAAAVKQALVTRYRIAPDRLSTNGFGSSSPVDTNDTLEGRARNRRVELTRE